MATMHLPDKKTINLTVNKMTHQQYIDNLELIKTELSDEFFMTVDDEETGINGTRVVYMTQAEYDALEEKDSALYYATPSNDKTFETKVIDDLSALSADLKNLTDELAELEETTGSSASGTTASITAINNQITAINNQITNLQSNINGLTNQTNTLTTNVTNISQTLGGYGALNLTFTFDDGSTMTKTFITA